ncbi:MAG: hypothetical protein LBV55_02165 [Acholeplasmatales bacterium]|jgi:hypothetical protein|nr:hypothetical protein [Acholeplasmatales bacterium]
MEEPKKSNKLHKQISNIRFRFRTFVKNNFSKYFGFEHDVDVTDELQVLVRRNIVMKNFIFISNIIYTILLTIVSIFLKDPLNWLFTAISFLATAPVNILLKKLIYYDTKNITRQNVAMYIASLYIFLVSILLYLRVYSFASLEIGGYLLLFYSLVVVSLYQDRKLLSGLFFGFLAGITIVHITCTYPIFQAISDNNLSFASFWPWFFGTSLDTGYFGGLLLRTLVFILFYFVLFTIVSIANYMQDKRVEELKQKKQVQQDFANIVRDIFGILVASANIATETKARYVQAIAKKLCIYCNLNEEESKMVEVYSTIQLEYAKLYDLVNVNIDEIVRNYEEVHQKTKQASLIARRLQLAQKASDIVRSYFEQTFDESRIQEFNKIQPQIEAQIILLSEVYIILREPNSYKRPQSNAVSLEQIRKHFYLYFDAFVVERFLANDQEIKIIYENF